MIQTNITQMTNITMEHYESIWFFHDVLNAFFLGILTSLLVALFIAFVMDR